MGDTMRERTSLLPGSPRREARGFSATAPAPPASRLWEIDVARTAAIVMMVVYHTVYDIEFMVPDVGIDPYNGGWRALQVTCASTFLALVGVSAWVRDQRLRARGVTGLAAWRLSAPRGVQVAAGAAAVSLATFAALGGDDVVRFGILHLIAVAHLVVLPLLVRFGVWNIVVGVTIVIAGLVLKGTGTGVPALMMVGLDPGETGVDWMPLLPWIGVPLIGVAVGAVLYPGGERHHGLRRLVEAPAWVSAVGAPGQRSLTVYLLHQPVLIALTAGVLLLIGTSPEGF